MLLSSTEPVDVFARVVGFTLLWVAVRLVASAFWAGHARPVSQGTKTVIVVHSGFQAFAAIWLVCYDPVVAPLVRAIAGGPASLDLANANSPGVSLLATVAAGEFTCQLLHLSYWYEKPSDLLMVGHHLFSAAIWPIAVAARRSHFFLANMLFYELSTPFMGLLHFFKGDGWKTTYAILGSLFTLAFVVARLCTLPFSAYAMYLTWDTWAIATPPAGSALPRWILVLEKVAVPLPALLNVYWGRLVVVGYMKAVLGGKQKKGKGA